MKTSQVTDTRSGELPARRTVGAVLGVSGVISLGTTLDSSTFFAGVFSLVALLLMIFCFGGMIVAGVGLWKGWRLGPIIGLAALVPQVLFIQVDRFVYWIAAVPVLELQLLPGLRVSFVASSAFRVLIRETPQVSYLAFNVLALVLIGILAEFYSRG